jgi:deoxyribodipyrimidine photo-lyase
MTVHNLRLASCIDRPVRAEGRYVLYWMTAARRLHASFALDRAVFWARQLGRPLVIFEPLRCGHRWASDRLHRFVLQGIAEKVERLRGSEVLY